MNAIVLQARITALEVVQTSIKTMMPNQLRIAKSWQDMLVDINSISMYKRLHRVFEIKKWLQKLLSTVVCSLCASK